MTLEHRRTPDQVAEIEGRMNESDTFGEVRFRDPHYRTEMQKIKRVAERSRRPVSFRAFLEVIKRFQPLNPEASGVVDPTAPIKQFPNSLRAYLVRRLGIEDKNVRFWTMVNSGAQDVFDVDAVIEIKRPIGQSWYPVPLKMVSERRGDRVRRIEGHRVVTMEEEVPSVHILGGIFPAFVSKVGEDIMAALGAEGFVESTAEVVVGK